MSRSNVIQHRIEGPLFIITLNNEKKLNSLHLSDYTRMTELLLEAEANPEILCIVFQGTGRFFSSGIDIDDLSRQLNQPKDFDLSSELVSRMEYFTRTAINHKKILVSCLNGPAVGISAAMVLLCDIVYSMNDNVYISFPFSKMGLANEGALSESLASKVGPALAHEAMFFGVPLQYDQLKDRVINRNYNMTNLSEFNSKVLEDLKQYLESCSPESLQNMKRLFLTVEGSSKIHAISNEGITALNLIHKNVPNKRIKAYVEQRRSKL
ncbi:HHR113Cp [Eremothecium sinecaudum]|uniref:HHR113Cp n=1 Tax=Eremothecium sinecaudum TaxID=45286 RepID=A0A0X8HWN3_9SACH|nr:HHR113Cp [Eremothecium sinecaudum]AMD22882.1 HHR113Cp [Eremothecium sinecaudum]